MEAGALKPCFKVVMKQTTTLPKKKERKRKNPPDTTASQKLLRQEQEIEEDFKEFLPCVSTLLQNSFIVTGRKKKIKTKEDN